MKMKKSAIVALPLSLCFLLATRADDVSDIAARWTGSIPTLTLASGAKLPELGEISSRSVLVEGDFARFEKVWTRLEKGESIRIAVFGGSITQGASASVGAPPGSTGNRWCDRFCEGWRRAFPNAKIDLINAGVGATGSNIGAYRLKRDVLNKNPDVVVVEFSVNDKNTSERAASYEGVVRQLLKAPGDIAVILIGMVSKDGQSAQECHGKVAQHYNLPFVSYRDAVYPCIESGAIEWSDISPDAVHPNYIGHAYAAALLNRYLASRYVDFKASARPPAPIPPLPEPLFGTRYDKGVFLEMTAVKTLENKGFFPLRDTCWGEGLACTNAMSTLSFEVEGSTVALLYRLGREPYNWGKIDVLIDGENVARGVNCFRNQGWWYTPSLILCRDKPGRHVVQITALPEKDNASEGYGCHLTGVLVSDYE